MDKKEAYPSETEMLKHFASLRKKQIKKFLKARQDMIDMEVELVQSLTEEQSVLFYEYQEKKTNFIKMLIDNLYIVEPFI